MISAAQLASMQATVNASLDQSVTVKRHTLTKTATGHATASWSSIVTTTCSLDQPSGTLLQNYDYLIGSLNTWVVTLPVGTNVLSDDRLVIGSQTMRVMVLLAPESYPLSVPVLAAEIQGEAN